MKPQTQKQTQEDWRGEKGKYYDLGYTQAKHECEKELVKKDVEIFQLKGDIKQAKQEVQNKCQMYFDSCFLLKKVPKWIELKKKLEELGKC